MSAAVATPVFNHGHAKKLSLLDLFRALAAFWVLGAHLGILVNRRVYPLSEGRIPVDLFIFLSGFLMLHLLWREQQSFDLRRILGFYLRRFFRIAPCFYVALFFYVCLRGFYRHSLADAEVHFGTLGSFTNYIVPIGTSDVLAHLGFLHGLGQVKNTKIFGPAWTLSLEMQFYAVAPFLVYFMRRRPTLTLLAAFACNAAAWWWFGAYDHLGHRGQHFFPSFLPDRLFLFCFGATACLCYTDPTALHRWLLAACAVGSLVLFPLDSVLLCFALTAGLMLVFYAPASPIRFVQRLASSKFIGWGAELSYSVYLAHQFCFAVTAWLLQRWIVSAAAPEADRWFFALTAVAVTVATAGLMFYVVEQPARDWGKHWGNRLLAPLVPRRPPVLASAP